MDPFRQFRLVGLLVLGLIVLGTAGFMVIEHWTFLDALFMTVITITTIGYGVPRPLTASGKVFTIILALSGFLIISVIVLWTIGTLVELAATERLQHLFWRRRMEKIIRSIRDHYIICGFGRMGQAIVGEFRSRNVTFVVVENNPEQLPRLVAEKIPFVEGDATDDKVLLAAGVDRARGLISVAPTDADNTFITLTAKGLNPRLFVVARSIKVEDEPKLRRAGADRVLSPYINGGKRMAWAVLRPNVVDFLESALYSESLELEISEVLVNLNSDFANKTIRDSRIREISGATVIAVKSRGGALTSSPAPDMAIREGDILIVVGTPRQLEALQGMAGQ